MTDNELELVNNVAQKLELYIKKNNQTVFSLAKIMNIDRQPFYRIINRKNVPTLSSLFIIANNLNCTIQELISKNIYIDIPVYEKVNNDKSDTSYRVFLSYKDYQQVDAYELYGIIFGNELKVYHRIKDFMNDGVYIVNYNAQMVEMEILSAGSRLIIALINGVEERINYPQITPIAKYYKTIPICANSFAVQNSGN